MAQTVDFATIGKLQKKYGDTFIKNGVRHFIPQVGATYRVRFLGELVCFKKYIVQHNGKWRTAICKDQNTCPVAAKHNLRPSIRMAINFIDRADNKIKVIQSVPLSFVGIKEYFDTYQRMPGQSNGAQFELKVINKNKFTLQMISHHALSKQDLQLIKQNGGIYKVKQIFKAEDPEKIQDVLFGDEKNDKMQVTQKQAQQPKIVQQDRRSKAYDQALSDLF